MSRYEVAGTYGGSKTPCTVFVYEEPCGTRWYACEGSTNINATSDEIEDGVDVEEVNDSDTIQADAPVTCPADVEDEVDDYLYG